VTSIGLAPGKNRQNDQRAGGFMPIEPLDAEFLSHLRLHFDTVGDLYGLPHPTATVVHAAWGREQCLDPSESLIYLDVSSSSCSGGFKFSLLLASLRNSGLAHVPVSPIC
jgi:hypothetical protein